MPNNYDKYEKHSKTPQRVLNGRADLDLVDNPIPRALWSYDVVLNSWS